MHYRNCNGPGQFGPAKQVVCPTNKCVHHNYYLSEVDYIHPTHTTVYNHHLTKNNHHFPQTQSVVDTFSEENNFMGPQNQVAGAQFNGGMGPQGEMGFMGPPWGNMATQGPNLGWPNPHVGGTNFNNMGMMGEGCRRPSWLD
ncbi:CotD family spore coat protein [Thalassobacillus sp. CUG 92003]|uniref:CotD family spore coat protein n=1 Tax=Thalassobacillus sp. CUG 92003 TaxID=2736641 RepID=UPI0015E6EAE1|nr:CotD family spore coat protein [Thalassobacillus sp. CUG 92003]